MLSLPLLSCNFSKRLLLLYEKREKSTPFDSKGVSHWIGGKRTRDIRSSMERGIELFLFFTFFFFVEMFRKNEQFQGRGTTFTSIPGT